MYLTVSCLIFRAFFSESRILHFSCSVCSHFVQTDGYSPSYNDQYNWTLSFPTANSFQVCLYRIVTPMGWADGSLKFKWSYTTTACAAGQYIDANYQCQACQAGSYGAFALQLSAACSGLCSAGMCFRLLQIWFNI